MKIHEIFNKTKGARKVIVLEEVNLKYDKIEYCVQTYALDKRGETLIESTTFRSKLAALKYAEFELTV